MAVGVPLIAPVTESRVRPVGSDGDTDHDVIAPPLTVGVTVVIGVPIVSVNEFGLYAKVDGATSFTSMVIVAESVPPVLVAVMV